MEVPAACGGQVDLDHRSAEPRIENGQRISSLWREEVGGIPEARHAPFDVLLARGDEQGPGDIEVYPDLIEQPRGIAADGQEEIAPGWSGAAGTAAGAESRSGVRQVRIAVGIERWSIGQPSQNHPPDAVAGTRVEVPVDECGQEESVFSQGLSFAPLQDRAQVNLAADGE